MARPDAERTAEEESADAQPGIGTDPARTPQEDGNGTHRVVAPDEEKVKEHECEQKERRENETPEERAERVKDA